MREFVRLVAMQKAGIPAPCAIAVLSGFRIRSELGDAVIIEGIEPAVQLDHYLSDLEIAPPVRAGSVEARRAGSKRRPQLAMAKLGHSDLHLGNFLLHDDKVYLLDGYAVRRGGLRLKDLLLLGHSARQRATSDLLRGWQQLTRPGATCRRPIQRAAVSNRKFLER